MTLGGKPLGRYSIRERARNVAYVPQVHIGTFAFTVEAVVLMGRTAHGNLFSRPSAHDREVAHAVLERFGIAHAGDAAVHHDFRRRAATCRCWHARWRRSRNSSCWTSRRPASISAIRAR